MQTFQCSCGNKLFFESAQCLSCERPCGCCEGCDRVVPIVSQLDGSTNCGNPDCRTAVKRCSNQRYGVCNRLISKQSPSGVCRYCALTSVIPDLNVDGNLVKWLRLERAKQRVLFLVEQIGLPLGSARENGPVRLTFEFKADQAQPVATGHSDGCIVINIKEADSIERERSRVKFGEPQRSLVGHFRHELGHFYWDYYVKGQREAEFVAVFGDHLQPSYGDAMQRYYDQGPLENWQTNFISAYATMHPWEDFAESFGTYLDMCSIVNSACHFGLGSGALEDFDLMLADYVKVGVMANEFNRDMGLLDLVPEVFVKPVVEKLRFVHQLRYWS